MSEVPQWKIDFVVRYFGLDKKYVKFFLSTFEKYPEINELSSYCIEKEIIGEFLKDIE
jgi:hypothetical protein